MLADEWGRIEEFTSTASPFSGRREAERRGRAFDGERSMTGVNANGHNGRVHYGG
jgi:hypothetical protein